MWNIQAFQYFDSCVYSHHQSQQHGGVVLAAPGDDPPPAGTADLDVRAQARGQCKRRLPVPHGQPGQLLPSPGHRAGQHPQNSPR